MSIIRRYFSIISGAPDGGSSDRVHAPRRHRAIVVTVVAAALLLGATVSGTLSTKASVDAAVHGASAAPEPIEISVYFPSQYVNQATEVEEHIQAF